MKKIILIPLIILILSPVIVGAADPVRTGDPGGAVPEINASIPNPTGINSLSELFYKIINFVISISYAVVAFFLILSGFKFVAAQGSEDKLKDAKDTFKYTIVGAVLVIGAQVIVEVVKGIIAGIGS